MSAYEGEVDGLSSQILDRIVSAYGLSPVRRAFTIRLGSSNAVFGLITGAGTRVLRRTGRPLREVIAQNQLQRYLADRRFPALAPIATHAGETYVAVAGRVYVLQPFVNGQHPTVGDANGAELAGEAMARLHALTASYSGEAPNQRLGMRGRFLASASRFPARVNAVLADPGAADVHDAVRWLGTRVQQLAAELTRPRNDPSTLLIHGDLNPGNLIVRDRTVAAVLDFDLATRDERVVDVAVALHYLGGGPADRDGSWADAAEALLRAYGRGSTLLAGERQLLGSLTMVKAARSPMRMLRHLTKAPVAERGSVQQQLSDRISRLQNFERRVRHVCA